MTEFKIRIKEGATPAENSLEVMYDGDADQIAKILAHAMSVDPDIKNVILKALPIYLQKENIDTQTFCNSLMAQKKSVNITSKIIPHELVHPIVECVKISLQVQEMLKDMPEEELLKFLAISTDQFLWLNELLTSKQMVDIVADREVQELITNTKITADVQIKQYKLILEILEKD